MERLQRCILSLCVLAKPFNVSNSAEFHSDLEFLADIQKAYREFFLSFLSAFLRDIEEMDLYL